MRKGKEMQNNQGNTAVIDRMEIVEEIKDQLRFEVEVPSVNLDPKLLKLHSC